LPYVCSFGLPVAILRPFNTYGPRQSERAVIPAVIRQALDPMCPAIKIGDVSTTRDFTFVDDTVAAFLAIGSSQAVAFGRPYNAGSGKAVSVAELVGFVKDATGCDKPVEQDLARMRPSGSEVRALLADSSRIAAETGWRPSVDLREGLSRTIEWWRRRLAGSQVRRQRDFMS
jgi:UDP-glucose 4-epimerase